MASVETELRLGLPGGELEASRGSGKRVFSEILDLKLKFPAAENGGGGPSAGERMKNSVPQKSLVTAAAADTEKPPAPKAQVVGWPPVRSFRRNILSVSPGTGAKEDKEKAGSAPPPPSMATAAAFVKVSMDGAPYLRKVDLRSYRSYEELSMALEEMFGSFTSSENGKRDSGSHQSRDFMSETKKTMDLLKGSDFVPTYEDKDGDWMLVGDVPWEMFVNSCKRLRIMRGSEAVGLVPGGKIKD